MYTWTTEPDHNSRRGIRYVLRNPDVQPSPLVADDRLAVCSQDGRTWTAVWWNHDYTSTKRTAGTPERAMRLLSEALGI